MSHIFIPINSGYCFTPKDFWKTTYYKEEETEQTPMYIYYFELGSKKCLYDTGYSEYFHKKTSFFSNFLYKWIIPVPDKFHKDYDFDMSAIDLVFISHFHADHIAGIKKCTKAKFVYLDRNINKTILGAYLPGLIPDNFEERSIKIQIRNYKVHNFQENKDCKLISLPGHSEEHMGLLLFNKYFLIGDSVWRFENLKFNYKPFFITRLINNNNSKYDKTIEFLRKFSKNNPHIHMLPSHDPRNKFMSYKRQDSNFNYHYHFLILGVTEFLGSHLMKYLHNNGFKVVGIGRNLEKIKNLKKQKFQVYSEKDNFLRNYPFPKFHTIINCLAEYRQNRPLKDYNSMNICKKYIYISLPYIYFIPEKSNKTYFSQSNLDREEQIISRSNFSQDSEYIIIRPGWLYGPGDNYITPKLINALSSGTLPQIGNGKNLVSLTYIENAVEAIYQIALLGKKNEIYNLADEPVNQWEFINSLAEGLNLPKPKWRLPIFTAYIISYIVLGIAFLCSFVGYYPELTFLPNTVTLFSKSIILNKDKFKKHCKYEQKISNKEALRKTIQAFKIKKPHLSINK